MKREFASLVRLMVVNHAKWETKIHVLFVRKI